MTVNEIMQQAEKKMTTSIDVLHRELGAIRTGRASAAIIEHVRVDYGGTLTPIHHLANVSVPDARYLLIQPWDRSMVSQVEKAIMKSDLGLTPSNDGQVIRLSIPPLSQERRIELTKMVHKRVEEDKVAIRNLRRDAQEHIKKLERQGIEILACTTCLEYFNLTDKLLVGKPTTMLKSIESMFRYEIVSL